MCHKSKGWRILGFTSFGYHQTAEMWYNQLSTLGYDTHYMVALDEASHTLMTRKGYRVLNAIMDKNRRDGKLQQVSMQLEQTYLRETWAVRLKVVLNKLLDGYNVYVSDTDVIWMQYGRFSYIAKNRSWVHHGNQK